MATKRKKKTTKPRAKAKKQTSAKAKKKKTAAKKPAKRKKVAAKKKPARKATARKRTVGKKKKAAPKRKAKKSKAASKKSKMGMKAKPMKAKKALPMPPSRPVLIVPKNITTKQFTQSELMDCICASCGFSSRTEAKEFYGSFADMIQTSLKKGYKVMLPGLGKMQVRRTKARMGINPMTREPIKIKAKRKVAFTANKALKDAVL